MKALKSFRVPLEAEAIGLDAAACGKDADINIFGTTFGSSRQGQAVPAINYSIHGVSDWNNNIKGGGGPQDGVAAAGAP